MTGLRLLGAAIAGIGGGFLVAAAVDVPRVAAVVVLVVGVALVAIGWRSSGDGRTLGAPATSAAAAGSTAAGDPGRERPKLSGLGTRTEQILRLAEEQAATQVAEARAQADQIIAAANEEARAIRARAETPDA